jgi:hypothetical protein
MRLSHYLSYFCLAVALAGCATGDLKTDPSARLAVTYATLKVIESGPDSEVRAAKIRSIASEARQFVETDAISLDQLAAAMRARLAEENLSPSDQVLADALVLTVTAELEARVGTGLLSPEQKLTVGAVLGWVVVAAGG